MKPQGQEGDPIKKATRLLLRAITRSKARERAERAMQRDTIALLRTLRGGGDAGAR